MDFLISGNTDVGLVKSTNQDSLTVKVINTVRGKVVLAVICDGMGGLAKGEVASASVIRAFDRWARNEFSDLSRSEIEDSVIRAQWEKLVTDQNERIKAYGRMHGVNLGTTLTAMLITQNRYYVMNVGDSRAYEICERARQITKDQSFVAREVELGRMTEEQARVDERRNVLLQCVGASDEVSPDMFFGDTRQNAVYMLCCDGFRHEITPEEIHDRFRPDRLTDEYSMNQASLELIELNKQRMERDNITVALVRTF